MKRIFSLILVLMAVQMMFAQINVFKVTNTDDSGEGSLRAAVNAVNALEESTDSSRIVFDFSTNVEHVITLDSFIYLNCSRVSIDASDCKGTVVLDGVDTSFAGINIGINQHNITIKKLNFRNFKYGIDVNVTRNAYIDGCVFESNQYGVDLGNCISEVFNCTFIGNEVGVDVSNPWILGSDIEVESNSINHIHDNFIGITSNNKENGNEIGIRVGGQKPTYVYDNVICSNQYGISFWDNGTKCYIRRNYIGVNKDFKAHGNTEAGINIGHNSGPIEIGSKDKEDGNYIGYNKVGIVNDKGSVNIYNNYIGVTPDFKPMPNKEAGVSAQNVYSDGNYIGYNGTNGLEFIYSSTIGADFIGGDGEHSFPNGGYGIYYTSESGLGNMKGTHIFNNKKGGFFFEHSKDTYPALPFEYSQCLFGGDQPFAVKRSVDYLTSPVIEKMYSDDKYIYIEGTVELLDAENENTLYGFALDSIITVELFASDGKAESALAYLGTTDTDEHGKWSYKIERSKSVGNIIANATHQYHCTYTTSISPRRYTSRFSEPYNCSEFLYDLTRSNYYVKTKREGKGDGSSWDNAMDGYDFASVLPLVSDGATFHVAEGEYDFSKLYPLEKSVSVNNKGINIIGGYYNGASNNVEKPNANEYKTRFVANKEDKFSFKINGKGSSLLEDLISEVDIQGVEFVDVQLSGAYLKNMKVDSCLFYSSSDSENKLTGTKMLCYNVETIEISSCFFDMNHTGSSLYIMTCNNIIIKNSTFTEDFPGYQSIKAEYVGGDALIYNCTFTNIPCYDFITIYTDGKTYFYNNTVVGNAYAPDGTAQISNGRLDLRNCNMVGNIYAGNYMNSVLNKLLDSHDNLYSSNFNQITDKDKTIIDSDLYKILDGENKDGVFIPNLAYNGGFTPTIALKSDVLPDGTPLRFPRLENVLTDQRSVSRLPKTCMGAYEVECGSDTTFSVDTVQVGTKIYGQTFTKLGVHDSIFENLKSADGICDSIVMHKIIVTPDLTKLNYYVKTERVNKGDGSDWDNAMNGEDFAMFLPLAPDGSTFYVAEGTYSPFVKNGRQFLVNNSVTIKGGYPNGIKKGDLDNPSLQNKTIFNGEIIENEQKEKLYLFILTKENIKFRIEHSYLQSSKYSILSSNPNDVIVLDCYLSSSDYGVFADASSNIIVENTIFTDNEISIRSSISGKYNGVIKIKDSEFIGDDDNTQSFVLAGDSLSMYNVTFSKSNIDNMPLMFNKYIELKKCNFIDIEQKSSIILSKADSASVDSCVFRGIKGNGLQSEAKSIQVSNSKFESNEVGDVFFATLDCDAYLYRNTFSNNIASSSVVHSSAKKVTMCNNTVTGNTAKNVLLLETEQSILNNNTIVGNTSSYSIKCNDIIFDGNILLANGDGSVFNAFETSQFIDNLMPPAVWGNRSFDFTGNLIIEETDKQYEVVSEIFEGEQTKDGFVPTLKNNGGFTPTIALKSDKLSDGKSIRFPRLENVLTDQRGVSRFDETCMGAYELKCGSDTTFSVDTVQVGTKIYGQTFTKVGVHDSIFEMLKSATDCDSIVMHKVIVTPDPKTLNYYVKMKKEGDGDGRDWDNAMDSIDFATYLPLAPDGVTFYVAEGEYRPVYDYSLAETETLSNRQYTVNSDVTIRGGYPADAKGKDVPSEPDKYKTIFDGLIKSGKDEANVNNLFYTSVVKDLKLNFDGVILSNSSYAIVAYNDKKYPNKAFDVNLDYVSFENNTGYGILSYSYKGSVNIDHSVFDNNNTCIYVSSSDVTINNSSFEKNGSSYLINIANGGDSENKECTLHIDSSSFVGNTGYIQAYNELIIKNSKFVSNETSGNLISTWSSSDFPDFKVDFINNTFVGNKIGGDILENYGNALTTVERCVFADNECGNDMLRASSMSVNNSNALRNVVKSALFNTYVKSSFISDTIENCTANDIVKYSSEGCKIDSCLIKNNDAYLLSFTPNTQIGNLKYDLLNSEVVGNSKSDMESENKVIGFLCSQRTGLENDSVNIVRTKFRNNKYKDCSFIFNYYTFLNFDQCLVDSNEVKVFMESRFSQSHIYNSTFADNNCDNVLQCTHNGSQYSRGTGATYMNNTLIRNKCRSLIDGYYSNSTYVNNTIVGNAGSEYMFEYFHNPAFVGNLVFGNTYKNLLNGISVADENISSNVMPTFTSHVAGDDYHITFLDGNIMSDQYYDDMAKDPTLTNDVKDGQVNHLEDLTSLFEGTYNSETGLFTPVLAYNGGFTPTVALKKDVLADGTSIRFPRLENVLADQRGVDRLDETCMGAYEIKCSPIITELKDTVVVGDSYTFNEKNLDDVCQKVGSYYFSDTLAGAENCDSIVKLSLAVRPQKNENGYYVKEDGTGDGSDWINAMSPKDFAEYLPLVYDGETFHIAAGTFKSTYVDPELGRMYNINSSVTLIGGYPDTVTVVGVPPMPETYTTTLSADVKSGDDIEIYTNRSGDYSLYGFEDNDSILIRVNGTPTVSIYGITLSGVKSDKYGAVTMNDGGTLNLDKCAIMTNNSSGVVASNAKINVTSTLAYHNVTKNGAVFRLTDSELNVEHSSFHENVSSGESSDAKGTIANLTNSQSTFTNNTVANNWADMGAVFALSNSQVSLSNNTLVGNQSIAKEPKGSFVVASDSKSKVTLFGNMIVGNGAQPVDGAAVESEGYNIFSTDFQGMGVEKDMFMGSKDYEFVMDGTPLLGNADVFIANVNNNGGFTPTVAVIESMFDGGAVISIPSSQRKVEFDQREMVRKDTSCVGAFEFPTYVNYFVKQSPVGDGTGRDWDNAMGDTTFFRYFSIVPTGATFHVAAGTYRPLGDRLYNTDSNKNRRYYSSRPLNVFGGYHPEAKEGAVADPSKYVTLLTTDFNGDDEFTESTDNYSVMSYSNYKDNSSYVMTIVSKLAGDVQLKGLTFSGNYTQFRGSSAALTVSSVAPEIPVALILDSCSFKKTYVGIYSYVDSLIVRGCRFDSIDYLGLSHSPREDVSGLLKIENSSFTNLDNAISSSESNGKILLQNSTFNNAMRLVEVMTSSYKKTVNLSLDMYHNTFGFSPKSYQGIIVPNFVQTTAKGNIFNTNFLVSADNSGVNAMKPVISDYNLFVEEPDTLYGAWTLGENDMLVSPSDLTGVLPGTMGEKRFHAVSSLEKPENFTKVVALESDVLNEKYIRMPIEEAKVKADQIATERLDLTCMGAYEFFKGRDTVYITTIDTVCYGLNYQRHGWDLQTETLSEGEYVYGRFLRGKIATDTIDTLTLHVNPFSRIMLDQLAVAPTLCHGSGYGEVSFTPRSVVPGSAAVYLKSENGDTLTSGVQSFNSVYKYNELPLGKFEISVLSQTQCVEDTLFDIEVFDRDSLQALPGADNILTDCANEPNSELTISLIGFHPTMKFYHNGVEISDQTNNDELIYGDDAAVTASAELKLTSIPVGSHSITAVDVCDNSYPVKDFEVSVIPTQVLDMQMLDYTKETLACGLDSGFAKFHIVSGASSIFTVTSDNGYNYSLRVQGKDTVLVLNDLTRGVYNILLKKESEDCSDSYSAELTINSPEPLSLTLASNGAACAEGAVSVAAEGGTGEYIYHWTNPNGTKFVTKESGLNEASAGKYICVVEDETHCFSHPDSLEILPNVDELSELHVDSVATKNITCFKGENGTIEVYFSTENKQQSVACVVTNDKTKEETKTAGTYEKLNGLLAIRTLGVGSYSYEVYYGTEGCRLDTNSFKGTFTVSAKEVPFVMTPLSVFAPQTCINPSNGMIVNTATGWEDDYNAYLMTEAGGKHIMTPKEENGETKLYAGLLSGGSYYYLVEDACGSEMTTDPISMPKYEPLSLEIVSYTDSVTCARAADAEITFTVSGGIGLNHLAYVDEKSYTDKGTIVSSDNGKGYHKVSYKSVIEGCKDSIVERIRIAGPDTLAIKYTLNGNCLGSALLPEVTGESAPYTYLWSDGEKEIVGTEKFPFDDMGEGKTYSLTVSDAHKCDSYTKSFTIPSAAELPTVSQKVYPESEKCHMGNDGRIIVRPSLSKKMDYAVTATIFYHKLDSKDSIANECVLDPNGEYITPENLEPGYYRVTTRLGSIDCDMGVAPVTSVVHVDTLPPLKIQSEFTLTDHTCISPNGTASFNIEGWTYTHVADIYSVGENVELYRANVRPMSVTNYVGAFDVTALSYGTYKVVVKDRCGNKDESESFEILHKPTFIQNIKTEKATCINEPNGVLDFEIQGWTLSHACEFVKNDVAADGRIVSVLPVKYDTLNKLAYFHVNTMPAGKWRIWVANECSEAFRLDTFVTVPGIEPYNVDLIANESKLELTCPYDSDGKIVLNVTGGYSETTFKGSATTHVKYFGPTDEYIDSTVYVMDTSYIVTPLYDSLNPIVNVDTTYKFLSQETVKVTKYDENNNLIEVDSIIMHYDTILVETVTYPQLTDEEGNFINDTTIRIDSFVTTQRVPKIGELDSLATSPIEYDLFAADPVGRNTGIYTYLNLDAGTYRFTFKSALAGCSDKYDYDTEITKPANVILHNQVLPISCSSYIDGEISLAPRRGGTSYSYFVGHDSTDSYEKNRLYADVDGKMVEHSINGIGEYQIDQLFDQSDIKTIKWSYNAYESSVWTPLDNIIIPDSSDITEETYYKKDVVIKTPVYSNTHLEKFWHGYMGDYFEANVVSIANLAPGYYSVLVEDAKNCQYHDTFEVKLPPRPLKIDSVKFDADLAECDPSKRQILAYASGGWGSYNFTFSDKSKVEATDAKHSDGFRGGEATYYDKNSMTGWGVSYFLDPGNYSVVVLDEQGCLVEYDKTFEVKTTFSLTMDSTNTKCPEDPTAKVVAHFVGSSPALGMTYDVVEYVSPCSKDTLDDCREYTLDTLRKNVTPKNDTFMVDLTSLKMHSKTHGLFVYQNDNNHCGTYVQGTVVDTIPIFKSSRKSSLDVTCGGLENGQIELYVSGGTAPYRIQRNSAWKKGDELALYENLNLIDTTFKLVLRDPKDTLYKKDTIIEQHFIRLSSLPADTFYFTVIDDKGCKSVMGDTASFDEKIVIKAPEKLEAEFASSLVCKEPSVTKGGNIFFQNVKGGTAPYTLSYNHDYLDEPVDNSEPIAQILDAAVGFKVDMKVTDANNCVVDSTVEFKPGELQIDMYDFWATSWYEYGDVVALIDVCGPEATFDSVSYVFYENGKVDPRITMLDKRLYVYDLAGNKSAADTVYRYGDNTKTMVPDAYFEKRFKLREDISKGQAKHLNFFKFEDSSIDVNNVNDVRDALAKHTVLMKAYFLGCEYRIERTNPLGVINPKNKPNIDPIGQKYQIISFSASPNPFRKTDVLRVRAEFSEKVNDAEIYIYQIDGKSSPAPIKINPSELVLSENEYVYEREFKVSDLFNSEIPDYIILLLKTGRDQKSTTLLYYGVDDSFWK